LFPSFYDGMRRKTKSMIFYKDKKKTNGTERDVVTRVVQSPRCRILIRTQEKMAAWLLVGVYFYLFIYSPFRVGCWLYKLTTTELWASRRKWSRQFHALSSFFFFYNGCALLLLLLYDSCVCLLPSEEMTTRSDKWLSCLSSFSFLFFLSFPTTTKFSSFLCRQFDKNFMILFIPPFFFYYIQMGCSCLEYWSGVVVVEEIESGVGKSFNKRERVVV
jgi:hypothetical protein